MRFDDVDGYRLTAFATNTRRGQLQTLELRHRRRARCEDRIRQTKDTGLRNLPLHGFDQNRIWTAIVALATEITAWTGLLADPQHEARRWEMKRLRHRLFTIPASIARHDRRVILHLSNRSRCASIVLTTIGRLRALPAPAADATDIADRHDRGPGDPPPQRNAATVMPSCQNQQNHPDNDAEHVDLGDL